MAAAARTVTARAAQLLRPKVSPFSTPATRRTITNFTPRRPVPQTVSPKNSRFASTSPTGKSNTALYASILTLGVLGGGYYLHSTGQLTEYLPFLSGLHPGGGAEKVVVKGPDYKATFEDYQEVYNEIAELLESNSDYDDGSYGPVSTRTIEMPMI